MEKSNLNKVFIWSPIRAAEKLHKQANGNTLRENGVATFAPSMVWHYSKSYSLKGKHPFSLILCTTADESVAINDYLDKTAKSVSKELLSKVFVNELAPLCLPTGDEFKEEK